MSIEIKLTDQHFPVSPAFINFLHHFYNGLPFESPWHEQLSETLTRDSQAQQRAVTHAAEVLASATGKKALQRSYELFVAILTGDLARLRPFHERYRFVCVVGCPRHGGSYLTKQLFLALGRQPEQIPNAIAHDGFPDAGPFDMKQGVNSVTHSMQGMAEYLTMVELFNATSPLFDNRVIVPKKATKAAYQGGFFHQLLGSETEYIVTLRHPVAACISTYEKSGGLPGDGKFAVRGNIEEWARRDALLAGGQLAEASRPDYFDVYLRYWEYYHYQLIHSGLAASPNWRTVVYGEARMQATAQSFYRRYGSDNDAEKFYVFAKQDRHRDWLRKAEPAVLRVREAWAAAGKGFPLDELMEAW